MDRRRDRLGRWRGIYIASVGMENVNQVKRGDIGTSTPLKSVLKPEQ